LSAALDQPLAASGNRSRSRLVIAAAASVYLACALAAMLLLSPRVPYADVWRFLHRLVEQPFPGSILAVDNGHREVLPNALRYLELRVFDASQHFQIAVGIMLLLATLGWWWRALGRSSLPAATRAPAFLCVLLGLCWLGNFRSLVHGNESVHAYLVTLFFGIGIWSLARPAADEASALRKGLLAGVCGLMATLSFGSGISSFAAFLVVLALMRAPARQWLPVLLLLVVSAAVSGGSGSALTISPIRQSEILLRWISAPWIYASWPLLDADIASRLPGPLRSMFSPVASAVTNAAGPAMTARWPHLPLGAAGLAWLVHTTWRCARRNDCAPAVAGVALAWFALAVGGVIALARLAYFGDFPGQVLAPRYLVWSSLFWAGLGCATVVLASRPGRASLVVVAVAIALLPSQAWMWKLATGIRAVAEPAAAAAAVGIVDPAFAGGENVPHEIAAAIPSLRTADAGMFAWEETRWIGRAVDARAVAFVGVEAISQTVVGDPAAPGARRLQMRLPASESGERFLLVDADGVVRGLAIRDRRHPRQAVGWTKDGGQAAPCVAVLVQ
jgi:hypothetical protein